MVAQALPCHDIALMDAAERHLVVEEWNGAAAVYPDDRCLHELFEAMVLQAPSAVALDDEGHELSYGELNARANRWPIICARLGWVLTLWWGYVLSAALSWWWDCWRC